MADQRIIADVAEPDDPRVHWWEAPAAFIGGNALGTLAAVLAGTAIFVAAMLAHVKGFGADDFSGTLATSFAVIMGTLALNNLAMLAVLWRIARRRLRQPLAHYFPVVPRRFVGFAVLSGVAVSVLINGGNQLLSDWGLMSFTDTPLERAMIPHGVLQFAVSVAVVSVLAPLAEEFLFRGLLMRWLAQVGGTMVAIAVSAVVFGVLHGQFFIHPGVQGVLFTVELTFAGFLLAWWAQRSGTLRTSFAMHAAYNFTATLFAVLWP